MFVRFLSFVAGDLVPEVLEAVSVLQVDEVAILAVLVPSSVQFQLPSAAFSFSPLPELPHSPSPLHRTRHPPSAPLEVVYVF